MLLGKIKNLSRVEALKRLHSCSSGLGCKQYTRLEKLARDKHSSLLRTLINYRHKNVNVST